MYVKRKIFNIYTEVQLIYYVHAHMRKYTHEFMYSWVYLRMRART